MAEVYELLAICLRQQERLGEAIQVLDSARRAGVGGASLARALGETLAEAGRPEDAVAVLKTLPTDDDPVTLDDLGMALSDAGHQQEAIQPLERAVKEYPQDPRSSEGLGIVTLRAHQPEVAVRHLRHALELNPQLPVSWNTLGVALYQLHQPTAALDAWHRAFALDPTQYDALYNIGLVANEMGRNEEARQALQRFVATAPPARFATELARAEAQLKAGAK